ncbi:MAG: phosphatase PAP2 family protein [FCB group bacterium]
MKIFGSEPVFKYNLKEILTLADVYTLVILFIYTVLALILYPHIRDASNLILLNLFMALAIIAITTAAVKLNAGSLFLVMRRLYLIPIIFLIYTQMQNYVMIINPHDYDQLLINCDRAIFGTDPTKWILKISNPLLTEYLQLAYMTYFLLPLIHGIEIHFTKSDKEFNTFAGIMLFAYFISYLLYFILPAIGPRFTLHNFAMLSKELPGLWLTEFFRNIVNVGGGIIPGTAYPAEFVYRDCMPSGHTLNTIVNIYMAYKFRSKFRYMIYIFGSSLIFATIYLRYHYVVDVIAGMFCAYLVIKVEPRIGKWLKAKGFIYA